VQNGIRPYRKGDYEEFHGFEQRKTKPIKANPMVHSSWFVVRCKGEERLLEKTKPILGKGKSKKVKGKMKTI